MRRVITALLVLAAGTIIPAASTLATPAQAAVPPARSIGIRLLDAPADARANPRARVYIVDFLPIGSVIHRHILVTNGTASVRRLALYAGAASIRHGTFNVAAGRRPNELTTWVTVRPATVTLAPGASARVTATIKVPRDASPGERYAGLWAQSATGHVRHGRNILQVSRVGIRVYLAVGRGGPPASNFTITTLTAEREQGGHPAVAAQVRNTGGRALDLSGTLTLTKGPGALSAGPFPAQVGTTIAPGQSEPITVVLNRQLPDGPWTASIHLMSGLTSRTAQAVITFPRGVGAAAPQATLTANWRDLSVIVISALVLGAALTVAFLLRRRRSARGGAPARRRRDSARKVRPQP